MVILQKEEFTTPMPWPFGAKLSREDREAAEGVIRHLQTMSAFQQLAMETYNDALLKASSSASGGDEIFVRGRGKVDDLDLVAQQLLPAAERKVEILETMEDEHQAFHVPTAAKRSAAAYTRWTEFIATLLARGRLQRDCYREWIAGPSFDFWARSTVLDEDEDRSMTSAITELNDLIERAGLAGGPWLSINCQAFNTVRSRVGLAALDETDFRERFMQGMAGMRPRFFE